MSSVEPSARRALAIAATVLVAETLGYLAVLVAPTGPTLDAPEGAALGVGVVLFVGAYAAFHLVLAVGLLRRWTHVRGAVIATQAIQLGLAWNLRDVEPAWIPAALGVGAVVVLVTVLLPSVTRAIHADEM